MPNNEPGGLATAPVQLKPAPLADPIRGARVKARGFGLRHFDCLPEHLARSSKIKPAFRNNVLHARKHVVSAVNIDVQSRKLIVERIADEALRSQMITFIGPNLGKDLINARETL